MAGFDPLLSAEQHVQAQALRAKYEAQLLALEANLAPEDRCYDAGLIAGRLIVAAAEFVGRNLSFESSWLVQFFTPEFLEAHYGGVAVEPVVDDLLSSLGVDSALGMMVGSPLAAGPVTIDDIDDALATA